MFDASKVAYGPCSECSEDGRFTLAWPTAAQLADKEGLFCRMVKGKLNEFAPGTQVSIKVPLGPEFAVVVVTIKCSGREKK